MVAFLRAVGVTVGGPTDVAGVIETDAKIPATEATGWSRPLLLTRVHASSHRVLEKAHAIKQFCKYL